MLPGLHDEVADAAVGAQKRQPPHAGAVPPHLEANHHQIRRLKVSKARELGHKLLQNMPILNRHRGVWRKDKKARQDRAR